jgi:hypothetical protein
MFDLYCINLLSYTIIVVVVVVVGGRANALLQSSCACIDLRQSIGEKSQI